MICSNFECDNDLTLPDHKTGYFVRIYPEGEREGIVVCGWCALRDLMNEGFNTAGAITPEERSKKE